MIDERRARLLLNALPDVGPVSLRRLTDALGSPAAVLAASRKALLSVKGVGPAMADSILGASRLFDATLEEARLARAGMAFLIPSDDGYPPLLARTYDPPIGLYANGEYRPGERCVAVVGTRAPTSYGKGLAADVATALAAAGWCVVSGLARGVDTVAHRSALDAGGKTVAVLGCGADIVYPAENAGLYRDIASAGVMFSEFSLGRRADKRTFPMRNRIVAGMCRAVVVIESDENGGSMITARFANEAGRTVCAFPGRTDRPESRGCHALIRDGATLVTGADQIFEELGCAPATMPEFDFGPEPALPDDPLLAHFAAGETHTPDSLAEKTGTPVGVIAAKLLEWEIDGALVRLTHGAYERARGRK